MAKQTINAEMVKDVPSVQALIAQAQKTANLTKSDKLKSLANLLGIPANQVEVLSAGKVPFWPAQDGATCVGTIQNYRIVPTVFGDVGLYMVRLDKPCVGGSKGADGSPTLEELKEGDLVTVIERDVMKNLGQSDAVGRNVGIMCLGQVQGSEFLYWDYAIFAKTRDNTPALPAST